MIDDPYGGVDPEQRFARFKNELVALALVFVPHPGNDTKKKLATLIMFATWSAITVGRAFGYTEGVGQWYYALSVTVFTILGHMWGYEFGAIMQKTGAGRDDTPQHESDSDTNGEA